mgnify:CR=1 FL=1|jgi:uncharacterized membrane protein
MHCSSCFGIFWSCVLGSLFTCACGETCGNGSPEGKVRLHSYEIYPNEFQMNLHSMISPFYLEIKTLHLLSVAMWSFSTAVAFRNYFVPVYKYWIRHRDDEAAIQDRNDVMEKFDRGAVLEHVAFPVAIITGLLMIWIAGWSLNSVNWLVLKLGIILFVFVPVEIVDYYISHFGGNKERIRRSATPERYEPMVLFHWKFFKVTTPLVMIFIPLLFYLAVAKPM